MRRKKRIAAAAAALLAAVLLTGCGGISKERLAARENGIGLLESGDYEGAVAQFEELISEADRVTDFELDVLKYRAEAEFLLGDYRAAAYTYDILNQVDEERAEYDYLGALSLAKAGDVKEAQNRLEAGKALDSEAQLPGYDEAMEALAGAYLTQGDRGGAESVYQEMIGFGHDAAKYSNRLALLAMEKGEYEQALSRIAEGLAAGGDAENRRNLKFNEAVCYEYLSDYPKALELFRAFTAEFGDDAEAEHEILFLQTR